MLGQQDVGHRVVVRRVVGAHDARPRFSDLLGQLVELTDTHLTIATTQGPLRIALNEVHRAKRVPPKRRASASDVVALEEAADDAWPAPVRERLGAWRLRAADGWTGRANSALAVGDPGRPLEEAIDAVQRWYARRGQPAMINVPLPLAAPVDRALDARGWASGPPILVQTVPLALLRQAAPARLDLPPVTLAAHPSAAWLEIVAGRKRGLPPAARHVLTAVDQVRFAHLYATDPSPEENGPAESDRNDGRLLAIARGTVTGGGRWLGLSLVEVLPEARRRGYARQLIQALADWAAGLGATDAFLQVEAANEPAVALYRRLGFVTHHQYRTRIAPNQADNASGTC